MSAALNLALWVIAGVLALVFLGSGVSKLCLRQERLAGLGAPVRWVEDFDPAALRGIAIIEILAAAGLILPRALGVAPVLVPLAATGAVLLFTGAVVMRYRRGERVTLVGDLIYLAMAAVVAWGRFTG